MKIADRGARLVDRIRGKALTPQRLCFVQGFGGSGQLRVKPPSTAFKQGVECDLRPFTHAKGVEVLRDSHKPREYGDLLSLEALGVAASIPMFVEMADSKGDLVTEAELVDDLGSTVAA